MNRVGEGGLMKCMKLFLVTFFLPICLLISYPGLASSAPGMMKGPGSLKKTRAGQEQLETSVIKLVLQGGIELFQKRLSPIDGPRCDFQPTCSSFGLTAINRHGAVVGGMMTADRLIRCNPWKRTGSRYESLPNGKLIDPVGDNVIFK